MPDRSQEIERVWRLMRDIDICMFATLDGEAIRARPMMAHPREQANAIYFLTATRGHKDEEILANQKVCLSFARPDHGKFLCVTGRARVLNDRDLISDLWTPQAGVYWSGPDEPDLRAIEVTPEDAQYWEGPHGWAATIAMVANAAQGGPPLLGDQAKVDFR